MFVHMDEVSRVSITRLVLRYSWVVVNAADFVEQVQNGMKSEDHTMSMRIKDPVVHVPPLLVGGSILVSIAFTILNSVVSIDPALVFAAMAASNASWVRAPTRRKYAFILLNACSIGL